MTDELKEINRNLDMLLERCDKALDDAVRVLDGITLTDEFLRLLALQDAGTSAELWLSRALGIIESLRVLKHPATAAEARAAAAHSAMDELWVEATRLQALIMEQRKMSEWRTWGQS